MAVSLESSLENLQGGVPRNIPNLAGDKDADLVTSQILNASKCSSIYANNVQKFFTYIGYYANAFARIFIRSIEYLTRPMPQGNSYWIEVVERVKKIVSAIFSIPLAAALFIPAFACYSIAACSGEGRFTYVQPESPANFWQERSLKVVSLNACFQDPWSPLTGGVVTPFEPVGHCASRIAAVVNAVAQENPVVCMGQEFESLGAQDEFTRLMQQKGFRYFLRDLGSNDPIRNNSGLFVASKVPLQNVEFVPYPAEDRAGLAKWSGQGALTFTTPVRGQNLRLVNVHLNYGEGQENQEARNRQLKRHVVPLLNRGNSALFGDLNFDTASVERATSGLLGFINALEGQVTCTDAGKHALRGKSMNPDGHPCTDCQERIDALIYNPNQMQVLACEVKPLVLEDQLIADHYLISAILQIPE